MEYKRVIREDLSDRLIHLTRSLTHKESGNVLSAILRERQLRGGTGNIKGGYTCVCFSEAPIGKLGQILAQPMAHKVRYKPYGVMVAKEWLFSQGGRPAIYQPDGEFTDLPESHRHRHVCYDPPGVDFSWEREWRIRTDALALDPESTTVVVPNRKWADSMRREHQAAQSRKAMLTHGLGIEVFPWHFIALEDLGVPIPVDDPVPDPPEQS